MNPERENELEESFAVIGRALHFYKQALVLSREQESRANLPQLEDHGAMENEIQSRRKSIATLEKRRQENVLSFEAELVEALYLLGVIDNADKVQTETETLRRAVASLPI